MHQVKRKYLRKGLQRFSKNRLRYIIDFIFFSFGFVISSALALFISILINKSLSKSELGEYSYNKAFLELVAMVFTLTVHRSYLRFNIKGKSVVVTRLVRRYVSVAFVLLAAFTYYLTESPFAILFAFFVFFEERLYFLRSLMDVLRMNILKIGAATITLLAIVYLGKRVELNSSLILFAYGVGFSIALFFGSKKYKTNDDSSKVTHRTLFLFSVPALGAVLVKLVMDFSGQFFLEKYFDFEEVSKYAIGLRVILGIKVISSLLLMFYPMVYYREIEKKNWVSIMRLRLLIILLFSIPSSLGFLFDENLFRIMGAAEYLEYTFIFKILICSEMLSLIGNIFGTYLAFALKTYISLLIMISGLFMNVVLLWLFTQSFGAITAAMGVFAANLIILISNLSISFRMERKFVSSYDA